MLILMLLALGAYRRLASIPADISHRVYTALDKAGYPLGAIPIANRDVISINTVHVTDATRLIDIVKSCTGFAR